MRPTAYVFFFPVGLGLNLTSATTVQRGYIGVMSVDARKRQTRRGKRWDVSLLSHTCYTRCTVCRGPPREVPALEVANIRVQYISFLIPNIHTHFIGLEMSGNIR